MDADWSVYIVACADETYYTGVARSVAARVIAHNRGRGARYTRGRLPVRLLYQEIELTKSEALRREIAIKRLTRREKESLIAGAPRCGVLGVAGVEAS